MSCILTECVSFFVLKDSRHGRKLSSRSDLIRKEEKKKRKRVNLKLFPGGGKPAFFKRVADGGSCEEGSVAVMARWTVGGAAPQVGTLALQHRRSKMFSSQLVLFRIVVVNTC